MGNYITDSYHEEEVIHIAFGLHDKTGTYSTWAGTAMQSIIEHTDTKICFHILHDRTLTEENKEKFLQVAGRVDDQLCFHLLDEASLNLRERLGRFTIGSMFRIMLPELLKDLPKIIYLDADLLVNRDIRELWEMDIQNYCMAAVPDMVVKAEEGEGPIPVRRNGVAKERYFNTGVLYMNLDRIREKGNMKEQVLDYLMKTKDAILPDQDALNAIYNKETLLLDESWNYYARHVRSRGEKKLEKKIYHYVGTFRILYHLTEMDELYFETTSRTPWGAEECRKILRDSLGRVTDRINQFEKMLPQISDPEKKRIFYGEENWIMKNFYRLITPREEDYRILAEPKEESNCILPCRDFSVLKEEQKGSFVVFVSHLSDGGSAINRLEQLGLENGKDFFVIARVLSNLQGGFT